MEYWVLQYVKSVEIIAPKSLREKIKETLKSNAKKYDEFYKIKNLWKTEGVIINDHPSNFATQ